MTQTPEERRARAREYSRQYRQKRRDAAAAALRAASGAGDLSAALEVALSAMKWLAASDGALVALARLQAAQVDALHAVGTPEAQGRALRHMVAFQRVLNDLGGTPRVRMQLELRSRRLQEDTEDAAVSAASNVTKISKRPPKSRRI